MRRRPPDATDANIFTDVDVDAEALPARDLTGDDASEVELEISGNDHESCTRPSTSPRDSEDKFGCKLDTLVIANLLKLPEMSVSCCAESRCVGFRACTAFPDVGAI